MRFPQQRLFLILSSAALVLLGTMAWVSPFVERIPAEGSWQDENRKTALSGTIVREGVQLVLHNASGTVYTLADNGKAGAFERKFVLVTGRLDEGRKVLYVEKISCYDL